MTLADIIVGLLVERGPMSACEIAITVRRRKMDVLAALRDPRFERQGGGRSSLWSVRPCPTIDATEAAVRWGCDVETARTIIFGSEGFLERGLVASFDGNGRVFVTDLGREKSEAWIAAGDR